MVKKVTLLAAMALVGSMGFAAADGAAIGTQQAAPKAAPAPTTPEVQSAVTRGGMVPSGTTAAYASTGWHYVHATNCKAYYDGSTTWLYVYPSEGGYWYTSNTIFQNLLDAECAQGNWVGFYVVNSSTGYFNEIWTYNFK